MIFMTAYRKNRYKYYENNFYMIISLHVAYF